jgi:hypothetical protein
MTDPEAALTFCCIGQRSSVVQPPAVGAAEMA